MTCAWLGGNFVPCPLLNQVFLSTRRPSLRGSCYWTVTRARRKLADGDWVACCCERIIPGDLTSFTTCLACLVCFLPCFLHYFTFFPSFLPCFPCLSAVFSSFIPSFLHYFTFCSCHPCLPGVFFPHFLPCFLSFFFMFSFLLSPLSSLIRFLTFFTYFFVISFPFLSSSLPSFTNLSFHSFSVFFSTFHFVLPFLISFCTTSSLS